MNQNTSGRLQDLLDCLSKSERIRFPGWLQNELQGKQKEISLWLEQVEHTQTEEQAWQQVRPFQTYDQAQINRWNTALVNWLESYLAICAFREDSFASIHYLNRAVIRSNPLDAYPSTIRKSRKHLAQQPIRDRTYYQVQHELDRLDLEFGFSFPEVKIRRYQLDHELAKQNEELAILMASIEVAVRKLSTSQPLTELDHYCVRQLRLYATPQNRKKWPVAYLYCKIFDFLDTNPIISIQEAEELVHWFQEFFQLLRPDAQFSIAILIHNTLTLSHFRKEDKDLVALILEINIWVLQQANIFGARYFYRNMVQLDIYMSKKTQDAEEMNSYIQQAYHHLETLKEKLPPDEREEAYNYNLATLHFETGNYEALSRQIYSLNFKDYTYEISYLILWNKAQYELGEFEGLADRLKNLNISLRNTQRLQPDLKRRHLNQVNYFRKVVINYRPAILNRLLKQLKKEQSLIGKKWLVEKLEEKIKRLS
ncbi:MAG: hypothetical protein KDD63_02725 [Bacteroidetes bacterium]|nr:hypothetical protein [Bacteroidota bacterium]